MLVISKDSNSNKLPPRIYESWPDLVELSRPKKIVEFGSWYGRGTVGLLEVSRLAGLNPLILCVDTWLGSEEHWSGKYGGEGNEWAHSQLEIVEGEPQFIESFKSNIAHHRFEDQVRILRCPTKFSSSVLRSSWADADLAYVDADHAFNPVYQDLRLIKSCCPHALICGDDWNWPGVKLAVSVFAIRYGLNVFIDYNQINTQWVLIDPAKKSLELVVRTKGWHLVKPRMTSFKLLFLHLLHVFRLHVRLNSVRNSSKR